MKRNLITIILLFFVGITFAQEGRVKVFRDTRIINGHSTELIPRGMMKFIISHRFGEISSGFQQLYGLDNSTIRIGLDYGIFDNLNVGFGRSSFQKHYDVYLKYRILQQRENGNSPFSLVYYTNASVRTLQNNLTENLSFTNNLSFVHQLIIARKFSDFFSFQLSPSLVHRNFVLDETSKNDVFTIGSAGRFQLTKVIAINLEYYYLLPDQVMDNIQSSAGLGVEFETKGHIFQLNFTNSLGLIAPLYMAETTGVIGNGDIHFGFNITRDFKVGARR